METRQDLNVSVLIPCYNEGATIRKVVGDFRKVLPEAQIFVFDNGSTDDTASEAREAGAKVVASPLRGKGNVVRHMFETVDADYCIMVDGDDTYPPAGAQRLLQAAVATGADMVVGVRLRDSRTQAFRRFHMLGNHLISWLISKLSGIRVTDALSGYRVFSRSFIQGVPVTSSGFQVESELTLQAIAKKFVLLEIPIAYGARPSGSHSKLDTYRDGARIIATIVLLFRDFRPLLFFSSVAVTFVILSLTAGSVPIIEYYQTGLVPHFPRAILASSLALCALVSLAIGIILDTLNKYHREDFELHRRMMQSLRREDQMR